MDYETMSDAELNAEVMNRRGHRGVPLDYCGSAPAVVLLTKEMNVTESIATRDKKRAMVRTWLRFDDARREVSGGR